MKFDKKNFALGTLFGFCGAVFFLYFLGNVDTKFEIKTGHDEVFSNRSESLDIKVEKIVNENLEQTNVFVIAKGNISKVNIDQELDKIFKSNNIDKNDPNLNVKTRIDNYYNIF